MSDDGRAEAIATTGLFLNFIAVVAVAECLASWGACDAAFAVAAGVVALLSFAVSIACFRAQAEDRQQIPAARSRQLRSRGT
jgi:membrane protein implicated in regulation of membrane protease activity